ncbi:hypothetical protein BDN70DRAFT_878779 [Pholiota conissans]|uniref:Uncharacterized protein n=1 Tax=Pholiota conissans TaxID=109636 RepID=A0A9P5Z1D3_9AGAR|nr:hypothetical protein BDN70DRAFT_878779 [Pholiota conissans]
MVHLGALFAFATTFLAFVSASPVNVENRDLIADLINALGVGLVTKIHSYITLDSLVTNLISIDFDVKNPLIIELTLDKVDAIATINGTTYASFTHTFPKPGLVVPPLGTKNSGKIDNVLLTQGAIASLDIIPLGYLDLPDTNANVRAATIKGALGIPLSLTGLKQKNVTTVYDLVLF